jgi:hypothetical protein
MGGSGKDDGSPGVWDGGMLRSLAVDLRGGIENEGCGGGKF